MNNVRSFRRNRRRFPNTSTRRNSGQTSRRNSQVSVYTSIPMYSRQVCATASAISARPYLLHFAPAILISKNTNNWFLRRACHLSFKRCYQPWLRPTLVFRAYLHAKGYGNVFDDVRQFHRQVRVKIALGAYGLAGRPYEYIHIFMYIPSALSYTDGLLIISCTLSLPRFAFFLPDDRG